MCISSASNLSSEPAFNNVDLQLYARIARRLEFAPTRQMLDCLPEAAPLLFLRHDPLRWAQMRAAVNLLSPDIPAWTSKVAGNGTKLASVPERVVHDVVHQICPDDVEVKTHPKFRDLLKADFALVRGPAIVFIEVLGMLQRDREPCNTEAENYLGRVKDNLCLYAKHGVTPTLVYLDDVCNPPRLRALLHQAINQLRQAA